MYKKVCGACMAAYEGDQAACPYCGQACENTNPSGSLPVGTLLNDTYRIGDFVAVDGEGILYQAVDIAGRRPYQIKEYMPITLCSGRDDDLAVQVRTGSEVPYKNNASDFADLYGKLRHFNNDICLLGVREVFAQNNTVYAVLEKAEGVTLTRYLAQYGPALGWEQALDLLDPLWTAVEKLHRVGLVHRGISCDNIYVTGPGVVRLGGYATQAMRSQGTELKCQLYSGYAAPEQYSAADFDGPFTDVYALSAVLYRVLTGVDVPSARERVHEDTLEDPRVYAPKLPIYLADALLHGLQISGTERFADIASFRRALTGNRGTAASPTMVHTPVHGVAVHSAAPNSKKKNFWQRMNPEVRIALCTGGALLLVFVIVLVIWYGNRVPAKSDDGSSASSSSSVADTSDTSDTDTSVSISSSTDTIPDLVGLKYNDARLQYTQYRFNVTYEYSSAYDAGVIIRQTPEKGAVPENNSIAIVVSQGVEPVPLPDLVGMTQASAENLLNSMGIQFTVVNVVNDGSMAEGVVAVTDPAADTKVQPGIDKVTLRVASPKKAESSSAPDSSSSSTPTESPSSSGGETPSSSENGGGESSNP